jgi:hypothetical protein
LIWGFSGIGPASGLNQVGLPPAAGAMSDALRLFDLFILQSIFVVQLSLKGGFYLRVFTELF